MEKDKDIIRLEKLSINDAEFVLELFNDQECMRFIGKEMANVEDAKSYIQTLTNDVHAVKMEDKSIGICGLWKREFFSFRDLGFAFLEDYRGKGHAFDACKRVLDDSDDEIILAFTKPENKKAISLLERLGFESRDEAREDFLVYGWQRKGEHECMSFIIDGLYLSDEDSATDQNLLKENKIKSILTVAKECIPPEGFESMKIDVDDWEFEDLKCHFDNCCEWIKKKREENKNVLVHCGAGVSRSSTIVIAYLMWGEKMSLKESFHLVKKQRPWIVPNEGFTKQLIEFECSIFGENSMKFDDFQFPDSD